MNERMNSKASNNEHVRYRQNDQLAAAVAKQLKMRDQNNKSHLDNHRNELESLNNLRNYESQVEILNKGIDNSFRTLKGINNMTNKSFVENYDQKYRSQKEIVKNGDKLSRNLNQSVN